ncbi:hypothetical protein GQ457_16G005380 [Hibiscus cannabinus]
MKKKFDVVTRGDNEPDRLVSYSGSARSKLGSSELDSGSGSARDLNKPSRANPSSARKTRFKVAKKDISGLLYRYGFMRTDTSKGFRLLEIPETKRRTDTGNRTGTSLGVPIRLYAYRYRRSYRYE